MTATKQYVEAVERGIDQAKRVRLFYTMHQKRGAYYRKVGHEVLSNGGLRGAAYKGWKEEWIVSATSVLDGAVDYQKLVVCRPVLPMS